MVPSRTGHAAPPGLAEKIGGVVVAINMSLLRSWPNVAARQIQGFQMLPLGRFSRIAACGESLCR